VSAGSKDHAEPAGCGQDTAGATDRLRNRVSLAFPVPASDCSKQGRQSQQARGVLRRSAQVSARQGFGTEGSEVQILSPRPIISRDSGPVVLTGPFFFAMGLQRRRKGKHQSVLMLNHQASDVI
jgi:hypothetical protein